MAEYTLKNIPEEIYHRAQSAAENSMRSLNQEIIFRLRRSIKLVIPQKHEVLVP